MPSGFRFFGMQRKACGAQRPRHIELRGERSEHRTTQRCAREIEIMEVSK